MHKRTVISIVWLGAASVAPVASASLIYESDSVLDTRTGLEWLNVWQGEPLVNRDRLVEVAGAWRHATRPEIRDFFFGQFGVPMPFDNPRESGPPFDPALGELILRLGGTAGRIYGSPPGTESNAYSIGGWYRSDWYPERGPTFDDMVVGYREVAYLGGWWGTDVGSIGSYTSVPSQFRSPLAYFLVRPLVPEPPVALLIAVGVAAIGAATRRASPAK